MIIIKVHAYCPSFWSWDTVDIFYLLIIFNHLIWLMVKLWEIKLPIFLGGELAARFEFTCIKYQTNMLLIRWNDITYDFTYVSNRKRKGPHEHGKKKTRQLNTTRSWSASAKWRTRRERRSEAIRNLVAIAIAKD